MFPKAAEGAAMSPRVWILALAVLSTGFLAGVPESGALPQPAGRDAEILAACMNGRLIALDDGHVMTCHIGRAKR